MTFLWPHMLLLLLLVPALVGLYLLLLRLIELAGERMRFEKLGILQPEGVGTAVEERKDRAGIRRLCDLRIAPAEVA